MESGYTPPALPGLPTTATQYAYNLDKQVTTVTRPDGQVISFNYDTGGRLSSLGLPGGASIVYQYSATTGKLTSVSNGSSVTLGYDGSLPLSSTWTGAVAGSVSRTYDNNFRIASMSVNGANTIALAYDRDSLLTGAGAETLTRNASNGFLTGTVVGLVNDTYVYNSFGETTGYTAKTGTLPVYSAQFTRDALGRIAQKTETVGTATINYGYSYDTSGRLTAVSRGGVPYSSYQYDANGNRLGKTVLLNTVSGTYDAQDRLTTWNGMTYAYTANGELTSKIGVNGTTAYTYDVLGNLTAVTLQNGRSISYIIDGMNRRIGKKVNGVLAKGWLYDGIRPVAELDGAGAVISTFVYASKGNSPDYMVKGGNTYRIISDHLSSPRLVIDSATGAVIQQIDYDEFGIVANDTNPGFLPFGFTGGLYDSDTKLTRFGARDYDAETGRWTAKDPIRFSGGDTNLYGYVLNDPVNLVDPSGLSWIIFDGGSNSLYVYPGNLNTQGPPQLFPAGNNAKNPTGDPLTPDSNGPAPQGDFNMGPFSPRNGGPNSSMGSGFIEINLPPGKNGQRGGVGVHAGRADKGGPTHQTLGCIRTNEEGIDALRRDPPSFISIR